MRMSGINVEKMKVLIYVIAGLLSALAAVVLSSKEPDRTGRHGRDV